MEFEFECKTKCVPRSFVNNGVFDCEDGSDEKIQNFVCFEYEFKCLFYENMKSSNNSLYNRCLSYEMFRDGKKDCLNNIDETVIIENCTHQNLFLCLDQSRCLPTKLKCDQKINCIDGSDELEGCGDNSTFFRYVLYNTEIVYDRSNVVVKYNNESYSDTFQMETKSMLEREKKFVNNFMFGLKCNTVKNFQESNYFTVPQPVSSSNTTFCLNEEDKCFDKFGKLRCFRCFEGTIIRKGQVCDGIVDCRDLSDECTCENSKAKPLCEIFYNGNSLKREIICNLEFDLPGKIDEIYCSTTFLFPEPFFQEKIDDYLVNNLKVECGKGKTAFGRTLQVIPGSKNDGKLFVFSYLESVLTGSKNELIAQVFNNKYITNTMPSYQQKELNSLSNSNGSCDYNFECPYREDECLSVCFSKKTVVSMSKIVHHFIRCFSFLFKNLEIFSVHSSTLKFTAHLYFNDSVLQIFHPKKKPNSTTQIIYPDTLLHGNKIEFYNSDRNLSFNFKRNSVFEVCKDNLLVCPWYFRCDSNKYELIEIKKVCDFNLDCEDQSDEKFCSTETHFNCTSGSPVSVDKEKVNDNNLDCEDRSDECKENSISSIKEMIKNVHLRRFIWVSLSGIVLFNLLVVKKSLKKFRKISDTHSNKYFNLLFILNLSMSDFIFGFVLAAITFSSYKFSGRYCSIDYEWRSSLICTTIGILTLSSSQTSLNILALMTYFRLYCVYKPFESLDIKKRKVYIALLVCWAFSFILSIIPIVYKNEFMQKIVVSKFFFSLTKMLIE